MALVSTPIRFSAGTIGNLSFYTDDRGRCIARERRREVKHFRQNMNAGDYPLSSEFGINAALAKQLRAPLSTFIRYTSDASYFNRLMALLRMAANDDRQSVRGRRRCTRGNMDLLGGFEFNSRRHLSATFSATYHTMLDKESGSMTVNVESFIPRKAVTAPSGTRYIQLVATASVLSTGTAIGSMEVSNLIPLNNKDTGPLAIPLDLSTLEGDFLVVSLGIIFYEEYNGIPMILRDGALSIVEIERLRKPQYRYDEGSSVPLTDDGKPLNTPEQLADLKDVYLTSKFPCTIISGTTNLKPAGDINEKVRRIQNSLWRQRMEKYRKG
jgi:hypothetical protein